MSKKKKRSKPSSPTNRNHKKKTKRKSKKPIYDSDSSSLSEGEIVDEKPQKKQTVKKRLTKKYDVSDESIESSDDSDSRSRVQEQSKCTIILFNILLNFTYKIIKYTVIMVLLYKYILLIPNYYLY
jgi:hypothetical protein